MTVTASLRWALSDESNQKVHVIDEGGVVRVRQVSGLVLVSGGRVIVNIDDTILHTGNIAQALRQDTGIEGVFSILGRRCED